MRRLRKFLRIFSIVVAVFVVVVLFPFMLVVSHDSACKPAPSPAAGAASMQAIAYRCYGTADVLKLERLDKPVAEDNQVLVRVRAAAVNPLDWHYLHGSPYIMRLGTGIGTPENPRLGVDFAGVVEAVGPKVTKFHPGDEVFGARTGAFAEYVTVREDRNIVPKPANVTFEQAAALPIAALTALQALRDQGHVQAGQKVLVNGASGGVGTYAVQIAKALGAEVTGVCSTKNLEMVKKIGADAVIDYTKEDFTRGDRRYDLIIDTVSTHGLLEMRRVLTPKGRLVIVGGVGGGDWIGPFVAPIKAMLLSPFIDQHIGMFLAELRPADLAYLGELMASGKLTSVIDRTYPLSELPEAMRYVEKGHARGKVVITVAANDTAEAGKPAVSN